VLQFFSEIIYLTNDEYILIYTKINIGSNNNVINVVYPTYYVELIYVLDIVLKLSLGWCS
jgi:outer membrane scaffolding protein for murein synthesis (MipA/OmpV family)